MVAKKAAPKKAAPKKAAPKKAAPKKAAPKSAPEMPAMTNDSMQMPEQNNGMPESTDTGTGSENA